MLNSVLILFRAQIRTLKRKQRAVGLEPAEFDQLISLGNQLRQIEKDRNAVWAPSRLKRLTDHELDQEIAEAERAAKGAN